MLSIKAALDKHLSLSAVSDSARLDVELLLCHVLEKPRTYLFTWPERLLDDQQLKQFLTLLARRQTGEPIAHLLGYREFWSLPLNVNDSTLIPRPATEALVEWILNRADHHARTLLDLGTGTGAIALAIASERPHWKITGVDFSEAAVSLARENQQKLQLSNCQFLLSNWFQSLPQQQFDIIVSNPPYIDAEDIHLHQGDVRFEPLSALVAEDNGLADLHHIIQHAALYLSTNGWLVLEHGYQQAAPVQSMLNKAGFTSVDSAPDLDGHLRFSFGQRRGVTNE